MGRFMSGKLTAYFRDLYGRGSGGLAVRDAIEHKRNDIVVNWSGGIHHTKKSEASSFCM